MTLRCLSHRHKVGVIEQRLHQVLARAHHWVGPLQLRIEQLSLLLQERHRRAFAPLVAAGATAPARTPPSTNAASICSAGSFFASVRLRRIASSLLLSASACCGSTDVVRW